MTARDSVRRIAVAALFLTASCAGGADDGATRNDASEPEIVHVHGLGVDPADETLYAATHHGVFRIPEKGKAVRVADRYQDTMGFTVAGPGRVLASGHPSVDDKKLRVEGKPPLLGLIESTDGAETWRSLSLLGEADFHALGFVEGVVYGHDATGGRFMASRDGKEWDTRSDIRMQTFAVNPSEPDVVAAVGETGLIRSVDGGRSWAPAPGPVVQWLSWAEAGLWGVAADGALHRSADGVTWTSAGHVPGVAPEALAAVADRLFVATSTGIHESADAGRTWSPRYADG